MAAHPAATHRLMAERLYIRLDRAAPSPGQACEWVLRSARGTMLGSGCDRLDRLPRSSALIAVAAQELALTQVVRLPPGRRARTRVALASALEPHLLSEPEANHIFELGDTADGRTVLGAMRRDWLSDCLQALARNGRKPSRMILEAALAPARPERWSVVRRPDGGFVATGDARIVALDAATGEAVPAGLRWLVREARASSTPVVTIQVYSAGTTPIDCRLWTHALELPVEDAGTWDWRQRTDPATGFDPMHAIDVLSGFESGAGEHRTARTPLRAGASLAALLLLAHVGATGIYWLRASAEHNRLQQDIWRQFQTRIAPSEPLVEPLLQARRALSRARHAAGQYGPDDLVPLLGELAAASPSVPGPRMHDLQFSSGTLSVRFNGAPEATIERMLVALRERGLQAEMSSDAEPLRLVLRAAPQP